MSLTERIGEKFCVLLNTAGGTLKNDGGELLKKIETRYKNEGGRCHLFWAGPGADLPAVAKTAIASGIGRVIVGGGDGTISCVANLLVGTKITLAVLPLGTLNHFARDIGIPANLERAMDLSVQGTVRPVDVGSVNERFFINNSSVGIYPRIVKHRDQEMEKLGKPKWRALLSASWRVFERERVYHVEIAHEGHIKKQTASFIFVGNNQYSFSLMDLGQRPRLDAGILSVYLGNQTTRWQALSFAVRALLRGLEQSRDFTSFTTEQFKLSMRKTHTSVGIDGEVVEMKTPLLFQSHSEALLVVTT
jgi:diacylglycerol kinase family enzyme